ncbi:flavodoxin family protein [Lactiplantibacillus plantarum]|nr:flavodoxin family protein [Lactiplantibacillus plantarum]MDE4417337.1 flavodoxin family protein [Lactiplantibacillus plantarum]MDE4420794.1 flavodoxin family protein [Lactiplantibacillus plantarum]MDE4423728.1 flavodoxin family protein [Lactiplantibacillus plantarum]MDE4426620.1 flavodoxin family protein [Lactiplantibacillus plantarum]
MSSSTHVPSNSTLLARLVLDELDYQEINLSSVKIFDVKDFRFSPSWPRQNDEYYGIIEQLKRAKIIVFSTPIYWYGTSAVLKRFIERWSESIKVDTDFRESMQEKKIVLIIVGGDNPVVKGQIIIDQFKYICEFLGMKLIVSVIGEANRPDTISNDPNALYEAKKANIILKKLDMGGNDFANIQ